MDKVREHHLSYLNSLNIRAPLYAYRWPSSLYIPAKADWKNYWVVAPPDENRYTLSWTPQPPPAGFNTSSQNDGNLYCFQRIRTIDKYVQCEAGIGVIFTPRATPERGQYPTKSNLLRRLPLVCGARFESEIEQVPTLPHPVTLRQALGGSGNFPPENRFSWILTEK